MNQPPLHVALYRPEIPPNTGNIGRLCAANHIPLHIVGQAAFDIDDKAARRAGLDYWPEITIYTHANLEALRASLPGSRLVYFTARDKRSLFDFTFQPGDCLVFGPESTGLPSDILQTADQALHVTIPMLNPRVRSLNLATAVGIALYEALRQQPR
jgi:tRNA (cytidine/uridine-2'-O-)-methyltransferase